MPMTKVCTKCGVEKGLGEFHKCKTGKYGVRPDCRDCQKQYQKQYRKDNRERKLELNKQYYQENRERLLECRRQHYQENRERELEQKKQYYLENRERGLERSSKFRQENPDYLKQYRQENRERLLEQKKQYRQENPEIIRASRAKRRAKERNATPDWLTPLDHLVIRHIYKTCPEGHHVDHIVPLKGETVSGLHVPWNLQHLPAEENISKGNREWPDMWLLEEEVA